jgi:peroxiredoxin
LITRQRWLRAGQPNIRRPVMSRTGKLSMAAAASVLGLLVILWTARTSHAEKPKIGDSAPKWSGIVGIDDKEHGLADFESAKLIVLVFTCNHCPVAKAYEDRLVALAKEFEPKGVQFVAVNVNNVDDDRLDKMKERAKEKGFSFPYLYDSSQKIGRDYGAAVTPHVFVLDKNRKLAYMGAIDDSMNADSVKHHFLSDALTALLDGKKPENAVTKQFGCGIKYDSP